MTCERIEELLSAYLEGGLDAAEKAEVDGHLAACPGCASLAALMRETAGVLGAFPEAEPSPGLMARLYAIPAEARERKSWFSSVFDFLGRPALQPVYAAFSVLLMALSFVLFHPEGRGIRKQIDVRFHRGVSAVERLYAEAGTLKGEIGAFSANVVKSVTTLGLLRGDEKKE